jgi:hypothetical protein
VSLAVAETLGSKPDFPFLLEKANPRRGKFHRNRYVNIFSGDYIAKYILHGYRFYPIWVDGAEIP